eukprot:Ihof_evm6s511 gene=Ihof_evmTU6s511
MPKTTKKEATSASDPYEKKKTVRKEKKEKDPNAPKKPLTAYILFCNDQRPQIRLDHPDMKIPEIGSKLGGMWKALTEEQKIKFTALAEQDKKRYVKDMEKYK